MARLPSVLCSIAALVVFAVWMRNRGVLGVMATALFALNGFLIHYGREARMYALLELVGVVAAVVCEAWLRSPRRAHLVWRSPSLDLVAVFTHAVGFFLLAGLMCPRRARGATARRGGGVAAVVLPALVYAVAWGWALRIADAPRSPARTADVAHRVDRRDRRRRHEPIVAAAAGHRRDDRSAASC